MPTRFYYDYFETLQHIILCKRFLFQQIHLHLQATYKMVALLKSVKIQNLSSGSLMSEICISRGWGVTTTHNDSNGGERGSLAGSVRNFIRSIRGWTGCECCTYFVNIKMYTNTHCKYQLCISTKTYQQSNHHQHQHPPRV